MKILKLQNKAGEEIGIVLNGITSLSEWPEGGTYIRSGEDFNIVVEDISSIKKALSDNGVYFEYIRVD